MISAAEELVRILADEGVHHLFFNPGTDTAPIQEALALARERGLPHPRTVLCTHEQVALSAALGNHFVTGHAQALAVHVDAGTLNVGAALHNVQRNHTPVVILAGRSPYSVRADVPGHRDSPIHWPQEQPDQGAAMRAYGKWAMEVPRGRELGGLVRRAFQVARAAPAGPAYLMLPREALMEPAEDGAAVLAVPRLPAPDPDGLRQVARRLADARRPVIVTDRTGRRPQAVEALVRVAELLGALVVERRDAVNFPANHPLYGGPKSAEALRRADVLLLLDTEVPWIPADGGPAPGTIVLQIDVDCVKATMPSWSYPIDLALTADTTAALPQLHAELEAIAEAPQRRAWAEHRREAEEVAAELHATWRRRASSSDVGDAPDAMLAALDAALPAEATTIQEAVTNQIACQRQLHRPPRRHFDVGAPALGSALGAALGAKLADPEPPAIAIVGDGAFNFGVPTAALWSAHRAAAPFVTVILNNGTYLASREPVQRLFPEGAAQRRDDFPETMLGGAIDYAALARSCGGAGEVVDRPDQMAGAMRRALACSAGGRCAVIDARLPAPG